MFALQHWTPQRHVTANTRRGKCTTWPSARTVCLTSICAALQRRFVRSRAFLAKHSFAYFELIPANSTWSFCIFKHFLRWPRWNRKVRELPFWELNSSEFSQQGKNHNKAMDYSSVYQKLIHETCETTIRHKSREYQPWQPPSRKVIKMLRRKCERRRLMAEIFRKKINPQLDFINIHEAKGWVRGKNLFLWEKVSVFVNMCLLSVKSVCQSL